MKKAFLAAMLLLVVTVAAGCGSSGTSTTTTSSGGTASATNTTSSGGASGLVAQAQKITDDALKGVVYSSVDPTKPDQVQPYGSWRGPTSGPPPKKGATVQILICSGQAVACVSTGKSVAEAAAKLGWQTQTIDGQGTPEGFAKAYDLAMSRKPSAILSVALPTAVVSAKIAQARKQGIYQVSVADADSPPPGLPAYDSYISSRQNVSGAVLAWSVIARSQGKANVIQIRDRGFPVLLQASEQFAKVLKSCPGCKLNTTDWQITDAVDATKVNAIVRAAVTQNPDAQYIQMPYSIGIPLVTETLRQMGKSNQIAILSKDLAPDGVQAVQKGTVLYDIGNPLEWLGYAGVNEIVRGLGGAKALDNATIGLGVSLFDKSKVPANGDVASWSGWPDYKGEYLKLWGVH